ncbi:ABC transporter permease [Alicyclobacillus tolerans]|uniref:Peptide/nickel transport system permease protein n=2 Tax=Alicyclobacillus tolerans TaxID=90970 RepID=A0ABT9LXT3_9BACL|nr:MULTISPECIES: ABC transporter permease [Alicyclobacillus]MDP9729073.1 peptide/nickel transport system permease protein [Alicyclobacillus tengchongensis]QRF24174.1 ABC transporter permease [Alicyclobacillus sp. TC]SHK90594.1 peptide/nickel transport system permease protein [Alicyclobacillus montanus]
MLNSTIFQEEELQQEQVVYERPGFMKRFWRSGTTKLGVFLLLFLVLFSFVGPLVYRKSAIATHLLYTVQGPSARFPLGTDSLGHNILAQLMVGGQSSLEVGFAAAIVTMIFGTFYGMVSGLAGGWVDSLMMRIVDVILAIPSIFILLFLNVVFQPNIWIMILVLASTSWLGVSRLARGEVLALKNMVYVEAAKALGARVGRVMFRYMLPNFIGTILVAATLSIADSILAMAGLSFLGLGLPPPAPNWGSMLSDSLNYMFQNAWWMIYPPGLCILISQVSINLIGDGLRGAVETRQR